MKRLANGSAQEQDQDHRCRDPEGTVQIRVALEHVQEVRARVQGRPAPCQNSRGVDIEELRVERDGPEEPLGAIIVVGAGGRGSGRRGEAG